MGHDDVILLMVQKSPSQPPGMVRIKPVVNNGIFTPLNSNSWNLQIINLERKMIFQTPMVMWDHVDLPGCTNLNWCSLPDFERTINRISMDPQGWHGSLAACRSDSEAEGRLYHGCGD